MEGTASLARQGLYTIAVDLFRIATAGELAEALVAAAISNRSALRRVLHQTAKAGRLVADALQTSAVMKSRVQLGEEIEIAFHPGIASGDPDRLTKRMRAIFQRSTGVSYLFAGSVEHLMRDLFTPVQRALHQFGGFHELRPITMDDWIGGLSERFAAGGCTVAERSLARIVEYGELHPRTTMLIAQKSHLTSVELGTRTIDLATVEQGMAAALAADRLSHEQAVERIRDMHKLGLVVAERLARGEPVYPNLQRGAVRRALEALRNAAIVESAGRGDWRFANPLLRRYLAGMAPF